MFKFIIPPLLVTLFFGFYPWGALASVIALIWYAFWGVFFPSKGFFKSNLKVASQALSMGNHKLAFDHIDIALREINRNQNKFDLHDIKELMSLTNSIEDSGVLSQREISRFKEELLSLQSVLSSR